VLASTLVLSIGRCREISGRT